MIYKNKPEQYYQCFSLKMMEALEEKGFEFIDTFRHMETGKLCKVLKMDEDLSQFFKDWSENKNIF